MRIVRLLLKAIFLLAVVWAASARAETLSVQQYLDEVKQKNSAYKGSELTTSGAEERKDEWKLITRPSLFGEASWTKAKIQPPQPFQPGNSRIDNYSLGVREVTDFGLSASLRFVAKRTEFPGIPPTTFFPYPKYFQTGPVLELSQSLLRNWGGSEEKAQQEIKQSQSEIAVNSARLEQKNLLAQAEVAYWRLALARETVGASKENVTRARRTKGWTGRRSRFELADRADDLQSSAALAAREYELQAAISEERAARRAFNTFRGVESDDVGVTLVGFGNSVIDKIVVNSEYTGREDLKIARAQSRISQATARLGREANKPDLSVFANMGLNGLDTDLSPAVSESTTTKYPTTTVGVRFTMPLDFGTTSDVAGGYKKEEQGQKLALSQTEFESQRNWQELVTNFQELRSLLKSSLEIEKVQREKLTYEQGRLSRGRTTTYQVILFEQDFANAQLNRLRAQQQLLSLYAQIKTYGSQK